MRTTIVRVSARLFLAACITSSQVPVVALATDSKQIQERFRAATPNLSGGLLDESGGIIATREARLSRAFNQMHQSGQGQSFNRVRISPLNGGVILGPPPKTSGDVKQIRIETFSYELLDPPSNAGFGHKLLKMRFKPVGGESFDVVVAAALAPAAALQVGDGRLSVFTLTSDVNPGWFDRWAGNIPRVACHPALANHRGVLAPSVIDRWMDGRLIREDETGRPIEVSPAARPLGRDLETIETIEQAYNVLLRFLNKPDDVGDAYENYLSAVARLKPPQQRALRRALCVLAGEAGEVVAGGEEAALAGQEMPLVDLLEREEHEERLRIVVQKFADFCASSQPVASTPIRLSFLSVVEEQSWSLKPDAFKTPDVRKDPGTSVMELRHRLVVADHNRIEGYSDEEVDALQFELPSSAAVRRAVQSRLNPTDRELLQWLTDYTICHRVLRSLGDDKFLTGVNIDQVMQMVEECGPYYRRCLDTDVFKVQARASAYEIGAWAYRAAHDPEICPPPQVPAALRLE